MRANQYRGCHTILTNDYTQRGYTYQDYLDWCEMNGKEPGEEDSIEFDDWCSDEAEMDYDSNLANIRTCATYQQPVRIEGYYGLWNGRHDVREDLVCESVCDAIETLLNTGYCHTSVVTWDDGLIYVNQAHHDGRNVFVIRPVDRRRKLPYLYDC